MRCAECRRFACNCEPAAESEWLSQPDGDGWWWRTYNEGPAAVCVYTNICGGLSYQAVGRQPAILKDEDRDTAKWQRIKMPTPPPAPLPRERQVTLTAKVFRCKSTNIDDFVAVVNAGDAIKNESKCFIDIDRCIQWVRDNYGLEPTVVEGEE